MSRQPLHETTIRNEHAYYQCIAQVLAYRLSCIDAAKKVKSGCGAGITHAFPASSGQSRFVCPDLPRRSCEADPGKERVSGRRRRQMMLLLHI